MFSVSTQKLPSCQIISGYSDEISLERKYLEDICFNCFILIVVFPDHTHLLFATCAISIVLLVSVAEETGLSLVLSATLKTDAFEISSI